MSTSVDTLRTSPLFGMSGIEGSLAQAHQQGSLPGKFPSSGQTEGAPPGGRGSWGDGSPTPIVLGEMASVRGGGHAHHHSVDVLRIDPDDSRPAAVGGKLTRGDPPAQGAHAQPGALCG